MNHNNNNNNNNDDDKVSPSRYFRSVREYVETLEGRNVVEKILVANNGIAAVKAIRSMRQWSYATFGNQHTIRFVVMATPEDIKANAEYVRLADELVQVPGEASSNNYSNVKLIVDIALDKNCDAVWPGWGHSSENPELPDLLSQHGIVFIGPQSIPMRLLGDKISSTILAQNAGVPTIPWSGSDVKMDLSHEEGKIVDSMPEELCESACVRTFEEAARMAEKVKYPLMIKASEGGGGKGIRKVTREEDLRIAYEQVCKEVSGSPVFLMRLASRSRHLEVQLIGDEYGQAVALKSRDCSVQRRHQKILEEGPVTIVEDPKMLKEMEDAAVRLARSVGYSCAGTVEYLYEIDTGKFFFLELNPRIQVEHPVTEWITNTNIPALQLQVSMGIPLHRIPDIRRFYGREDGHGEGREVTVPANVAGKVLKKDKTFDDLDRKYLIDFANESSVDALGHCIAARITAENPDEGFQPTSGNVTELTFRNTPNVWGYFSIRSQGQVHAYSDSQFGHIFAFGENREKARQNLAVALSEITIRGDIRSTYEYLSQLIEQPDFVESKFTTEWLDELIKQDKEMGDAPPTVSNEKKALSPIVTTALASPIPPPETPASPLSPSMMLNQRDHHHLQATPTALDGVTFLNIISGACHTLYNRFKQNVDKWFWFIERGQHPPEELLVVQFKNMELIYNNSKYLVTGTVSGLNRFMFSLNDSYVEAEIEVLRDSGLLILLPGTGESHVSYAQEEPSGNLRVTVNGKTSLFTREFDPSELRSNMSGKLVRYLYEDGSHIPAGAPYCEMEMMKMIMTVSAPNSGCISFQMVEGATVNQGDIIATMDLDDKSSIKRATLFRGRFPNLHKAKKIHGDGLSLPSPSKSSPNTLLKDAQDEIFRMLAGYAYPDSLVFERRLDAAIEGLQLMTDGGEQKQHQKHSSTRQNVLIHEFVEKLAVLRSMIPKQLQREINILLQTEFYTQRSTEEQLMGRLDDIMQRHMQSLGNNKDLIQQTKASFSPLLDIIAQHKKGYKNYSFAILSAFFKEYLRVEKIFDRHVNGKAAESQSNIAGQTSTTSLLLELRYRNKDDMNSIFEVAFSHQRLRNKNRVMLALLQEVDRLSLVQDFLPVLSDMSAFISKAYNDVVLIAKQMLNKQRLPSFQKMQREMEDIFQKAISQEKQSQEASNLQLKDMIERSNYGTDILMTFFSHGNKTIRDLAAEVYIRKTYITFDVTLLNASEHTERNYRTLQWRFVNKTDTHGNAYSEVLNSASAVNKKDAIVGSVSYDSLTALAQRPTTSITDDFSGAETENYVGFGAMSIFSSFDDIRDNLKTVIEENFHSSSAGSNTDSANVMGIVLLWNDEKDTKWLTEKRKCHSGQPMPQTPQTPLSPSTPWEKNASNNKHWPNDAELIEMFQAILHKHSNVLGENDVRRVTVTVFINGQFPLYYTFRQQHKYAEDPIYRHLEPTLAFQLFLRKTSNYDLQPCPIKNPAVHVFFATKKKKIAGGDKKYDFLQRRFFVRTLVLQGDVFLPENDEEFQISEAERYLVESLNALELTMADSRYEATYANHIFVNVLPEIVVNPKVVTSLISRLQSAYAKRLWKLRVNEVEIKINIKMSKDDSHSIPLRFIATNKTGYSLTVDIYEEAKDLTTGRIKFNALMVGNDKENDNLNMLDVNIPHQVLSGVALKRRIAHNYDTSYVYDFPYLYERGLRQIWKNYARANHFEFKRVLPKNFFAAREMILNESTGQLVFKPTTNNDEETTIGDNKYGMVVWKMTLKTPEYKDGREVIIIANDITHQSGSFGPTEDLIFQRASELSRREGIPRLYIAANSGARIGLADEIKRMYRVSWKDDDDHNKGFDYLYLNEQDYLHIRDMEIESKLSHSIVNVEPVEVELSTSDGGKVIEKRYRIMDIIGKDHGIGVENLQASGMIAGETSRAYNEVFTLSYVASRTVGIGAYLVRLGHRIIQNRKPPILLTGAAALNKVLGREVYSSNLQLGGIQIMYPNGVTHLVANDDLKAVRMMLDWLSYVPQRVGAPLPIRPPPALTSGNEGDDDAAISMPKNVDDDDEESLLDSFGSSTMEMDNVEREIEFVPPQQQQYDVRHMLAGQYVAVTNPDDDCPRQKWVSGFFDKSSFMETLGGWAKNVVVGRGRLGGIPMGVIAVDVGTYEQVIPADPADPTTQERIINKAGQVWFPDSAYKTAQAIRDFNVGEELPLLILANWRGFSGGQRDMFEEVLKFGSFIVDALVDYKRPVFVYIPPYGELRGGAWVVVDSAINPDFMEMYADVLARGNVLEKSGTVEIKYRERDIVHTVHRLDPQCNSILKDLAATGHTAAQQSALQAKLKEREKKLLPIYHNIAETFCDLHDTAGRMKMKNVIRDVLEWRHTRKYFYWRLKRRLLELSIFQEMESAVRFVGNNDDGYRFTNEEKKNMLRQWIKVDDTAWEDDKKVIQWVERHRTHIDQRLQLLREELVHEKTNQFCKSDVDSVVRALLQHLQSDDCDSETRRSVMDNLGRQVAMSRLGISGKK